MKFPCTLKRGSVAVRVYCVQRPPRAGRPAQTLFTLSWHAGDRRMTKQFTDESAAIAEGRLKLDQLSSGKLDAAASMTIEDAAALAEARRIAGEVPLIAALSEWAKARKLARGELLPAARAWAAKQGTSYQRETLGNVSAAFMKAKKAGGVKTGKTYKLIAHLTEKFGGLTMDSITSLALARWMQERYGDPVYFNTALKRFRTLWRWARKNGYLPKDAQTVAESVDAAREQPNRIGFIRAGELANLLALVRSDAPELLAPLVLAALCGMRSSEVHGQQWEDIDLEAGHVRVTAAKPNTPAFRLVPLCPAAVAWLLLCPNRKGRVCRTVVDVERLRDLALAHKMELPANAFRHSYISHAVALSGDVNRTALDAGNSPSKIFKNYRALVTPTEGEAWFELAPEAVARRLAGKIVKLAKVAR